MAATAPKCNEIGNLFASQYYRHLVATPETAHNFYHAEAGFSRLRGSNPTEQIVGHEKIKAYIASYNYQSCKLKIDTIDSQEKGKNEIIVLVSGIEVDQDKVARPFCQTFCLEAVSGTRYLVRNDVLCYLRNELLSVNDQKVDVQTELLESPVEEAPEQKEEEPTLPVHVDMGTQVDLSMLDQSSPVAEVQPPSPQLEVEQPAQVSPPKQHHKPTRADTKREPVDPSKPRAWSSVVGGVTSGGLPGQNNAPPPEPIAVNTQEPAVSEEEIVSTPAAGPAPITPSDKPKSVGRQEVLNSLYVSNFESVDVEEVKELFSRFGKVKAVKYNPPQSFLFVDYENAESADKALKGGQLKLGDFDLKLERRKAPLPNLRGRGGRGGVRGGRGRGGPPRDGRTEPRTTDRTERREVREPRPREGSDRSGGNRPPAKDDRGRGRGRGGRGGSAPTS